MLVLGITDIWPNWRYGGVWSGHFVTGRTQLGPYRATAETIGRRAHEQVDLRLPAPSRPGVPVLRCSGPADAASDPPPGQTGPADDPGTVQARSAIATWSQQSAPVSGACEHALSDKARMAIEAAPSRMMT